MALVLNKPVLPQTVKMPVRVEPEPLEVKGNAVRWHEMSSFQQAKCVAWCLRHYPAMRELKTKRDEIANRPKFVSEEQN